MLFFMVNYIGLVRKERTPAKNLGNCWLLVGVGAVHRAISKEYQAQGCHYAED